jgi:hypothetical protein
LSSVDLLLDRLAGIVPWRAEHRHEAVPEKLVRDALVLVDPLDPFPKQRVQVFHDFTFSPPRLCQLKSAYRSSPPPRSM